MSDILCFKVTSEEQVRYIKKYVPKSLMSNLLINKLKEDKLVGNYIINVKKKKLIGLHSEYRSDFTPAPLGIILNFIGISAVKCNSITHSKIKLQ